MGLLSLRHGLKREMRDDAGNLCNRKDVSSVNGQMIFKIFSVNMRGYLRRRVGDRVGFRA